MSAIPAGKSARTWALAASVVALLGVYAAQPGRTLTAPVPETVELKDMTWVEVRSALAAGASSVIVPTGGIEQNGPHMILGKHDYIVQLAARRIALQAGGTLVAPVVSYVPEGGFDPPTGHMKFPGTLGVSEPTFAGVLEGIATSLKLAGFKTIFFIGDHGQSQPVQDQVAKRLTQAWSSSGVRVINVSDYYATGAQTKFLLARGFSRDAIGFHASVIDTSELMAIHPKGVNPARFALAGSKAEPSGVAGNPAQSSADLGRELFDMRVAAAVARIKREIATR